MIDKAILEEEVIYEKTYPREDIDELHAKLSKEVDVQDRDEKKRMTFDEIMEEIYEGVEYELLPERAKSAEIFVELAKRISEIYELDVKITRRHSHMPHIHMHIGISLGYGQERTATDCRSEGQVSPKTKNTSLNVTVGHFIRPIS